MAKGAGLTATLTATVTAAAAGAGGRGGLDHDRVRRRPAGLRTRRPRVRVVPGAPRFPQPHRGADGIHGSSEASASARSVP